MLFIVLFSVVTTIFKQHIFIDFSFKKWNFHTKFHQRTQKNMTQLLVPKSQYVWKKLGAMMLWIMSGTFKLKVIMVMNELFWIICPAEHNYFMLWTKCKSERVNSIKCGAFGLQLPISEKTWHRVKKSPSHPDSLSEGGAVTCCGRDYG